MWKFSSESSQESLLDTHVEAVMALALHLPEALAASAPQHLHQHLCPLRPPPPPPSALVTCSLLNTEMGGATLPAVNTVLRIYLHISTML